jgi:hypothetical protein
MAANLGPSGPGFKGGAKVAPFGSPLSKALAHSGWPIPNGSSNTATGNGATYAYPDLVIRDDSGQIQGVRYEELAPMLLNDEKRQKSRVDAQEVELRQLRAAVAALQRR